MNTDDEFPERLKNAARRVGGQSALATKAGIPKGTMASYAQGGSEPTVARLVALARAAGVSVGWLAAGDGDQASVAEPSAAYGLPPEYQLIPHLDVEVSTGEGRVIDEEAELRRLAFVGKYLRKRGVEPENARLVTARGDSMEPTISDGDTILVDTGVDRLRDDSIYCIQVDGNLRAKRLQRDMRGGIWVISDNPHYEDEHLEADEVANLTIVGRVVWIGRDV